MIEIDEKSTCCGTAEIIAQDVASNAVNSGMNGVNSIGVDKNVKKQTNLSVFIPHNGCKHLCSFCNQRLISGQQYSIAPVELAELLEHERHNLLKSNKMAEIAFFGGSFTAIEHDYMVSLLTVAKKYMDEFPEIYNGIRLSTRPDCISDEIIDTLKRYGVTTIELGAQSMSDMVLNANSRGHSALDVVRASAMINDAGFSLGLQMMTGLYMDTPGLCVETAEKFIDLKPKCVRIYPTVILKHTKLGELYQKGIYKSFTFDETVELCVVLLDLFEKADIPVIRLGLHASRDVEADMVGGVYHPSLREICISRRYYHLMEDIVSNSNVDELVIAADERYISQIIGNNGENRNKLLEKGIKLKIDVCKGVKPFMV